MSRFAGHTLKINYTLFENNPTRTQFENRKT